MPPYEKFVDIYQDHGCSLAPSCLRCPFAVCRYDSPLGLATSAEARVMRDREVMRLRATGMYVEEIAAQMRISTRTITRVISRGGPARRDLRLSGEDQEPQGTTASRLRQMVRQRAPLPKLREVA